MTLQSDSEIIYKCTDYYAPECDGAVRWDSCGIDWPIDSAAPVLSEKDAGAPNFADFMTPFTYEG
jgi:dTDP-4-dehydrorhamnose 3,5-epimerase